MGGIYIKGMEMPTDERVRVVIYQNGQVFVDHGTWFSEYEAISVPPHGRLIDADALIESFDPSDFWNPDAEDNCFAAVHVVNTAPTIIPAEEGE